MLTTSDINVIGNLINTTWGRSSTDSGLYPRGSAPATSFKGQLLTAVDPSDPGSHRLTLTYTDVITFRDNVEAQALVKTHRAIAEKVCKLKLTELKRAFRGVVSRPLKAKQLTDVDSVEVFSRTSPEIDVGARHSMHRGYYRYTMIVSVA